MRDLIKEPIRTLFLGSSWESVETLRALDEDMRFDIVAVITTVDKPVGRRQVMTPSKVKSYALSNRIRVFHTEKKEKKYQEALAKFNPELIVCKAFGEIVPEFFIEYPRYKAINVHFSILPKYRGAVPIQKAILEGEDETGISIMLMSKGLDEGDILKIYKEPILSNDTNLSLRKRLVKKSAEIIGDVLEEWVHGEIDPTPQDDSKATYCWQKDISKENAEIVWDKMEPEYIERMVRAFIPWPIAWTEWNGKRVKLFDVDLVKLQNDREDGELFVNNDELLFATKDRDICIKVNKLQIEGKTEMEADEFINGFRDKLL
ncbi:MAG: methionyl-tRNA formyltransferase [candidate division WS6 bacterium 34_10]|uniref:Methionyl-tRNA formyltransferase n=1 Tax=candidate division WS6 bacterium 34_10 TaxID=1641389 RepID=A0A101HJ36_9BACT|nr:MAG: methionyl-tRNA formyltransferase [candidate division WS6 bacterium 34_10]